MFYKKQLLLFFQGKFYKYKKLNLKIFYLGNQTSTGTYSFVLASTNQSIPSNINTIFELLQIES